MSLMGVGFFGLFGLLGNEQLRHKLFRLSIFSILCMTGYAVCFGMQTSMFSGGTQVPIKEVLLAHPFGAWGTLASDRGIISLFPVFFWLTGAMVTWFFFDKQNRLLIFGLIATFFACLLTSTTYYGWTGGSSMPGRYIVVVIPLLFVGVAVMLERVSLVARTWFFSLSLFSAMLYYLVWIHLPDIGRSFILPVHVLSSFPLLQDLYFPHSYFFGNKTDIFWTTFYVFFAFLITSLIIFFRNSLLFISFFGIMAIPCAGLIIQNGFEIKRFSFQRHIELLQVENTHLIQIQHGSSRYPWTEVLDVQRLHSSTGRNCSFDKMKAKCASQDVDGAGIFAWGAYRHIFPGHFSVKFEYNTSNCNNNLKIITLDIAADAGKKILEEKNIFCNNSSASESFIISTNSFLEIEPRVYYHGNGDIILHHISIQEIVE